MNFEQIKTSKPFKIFDLFLYCFVLILVVVLFSVFVFFPANANLVNSGFKVILHDKQIISFDYHTHTYSLLPDYTDLIDVEDLGEGIYNIKIFTDQNKSQYNLLIVNSKSKTVFWDFHHLHLLQKYCDNPNCNKVLVLSKNLDCCAHFLCRP